SKRPACRGSQARRSCALVPPRPQRVYRRGEMVPASPSSRSPMLPTLASAREQSLVAFEADYWNGLFLPNDAPEPLIQKPARCGGGDDRQPTSASAAEGDRCDRNEFEPFFSAWFESDEYRESAPEGFERTYDEDALSRAFRSLWRGRKRR